MCCYYHNNNVANWLILIIFIKRVPLESLILYAKQMNIDTPARLLSRALEKPDTEGIAKAVINLKEVNTLYYADNNLHKIN